MAVQEITIRVKDTTGVYRDIPLMAQNLEQVWQCGEGYTLKGIEFPNQSIESLTIKSDTGTAIYQLNFAKGIYEAISVQPKYGDVAKAKVMIEALKGLPYEYSGQVPNGLVPKVNTTSGPTSKRYEPIIQALPSLKIAIVRYYEGNKLYEAVIRKAWKDYEYSGVNHWLSVVLGIDADAIPVGFRSAVSVAFQYGSLPRPTMVTGRDLLRQHPFSKRVEHPVTRQSDMLGNVIIDLNDTHRWSREKIADWLDTLDEQPTFYPKEKDPTDGLVNTARVVTCKLPPL